MVAVGTDTCGLHTIARTWELTPRLLSAFAAGVEDPNECYLDDLRPGGLVGHPGLVFTFQWNARHMPGRATSPEVARRGVHAWVDVRFARPFRVGDVITAQGRTVALRQIAPGVLSVQRYTMRDDSGAEVAVMDTAGILRGCELTGPDVSLAEVTPWPRVGDPVPPPIWESRMPVAPHAAHTYTECADIWNPIHTEREVARAAGLPDIILHGSATITMALREVVNRALHGDPTRVRRFAGEFRAMVFPGTSIAVRCLGERNGSGGRELYFDVLNGDGQVAVKHGLVVAG